MPMWAKWLCFALLLMAIPLAVEAVTDQNWGSALRSGVTAAVIVVAGFFIMRRGRLY